MRIDRRLTFIGVMLIVLSMTMATQYATTRTGFSYSIVHPSNADIRYIGSDNSTDGRLLRANTSRGNGTHTTLELDFGNWSVGTNKTYTAAFGIVNEEAFAINITHINVSNNTGTWDHMLIYLHANPDLAAHLDSTSVWMVSNGTLKNATTTTAWTLARGDQDPTTMTFNVSDGATATTAWDTIKNVRYSLNTTEARCANLSDGDHSLTNASDYVWVQISINLDDSGITQTEADKAHFGKIYIHFEAATNWGES